MARARHGVDQPGGEAKRKHFMKTETILGAQLKVGDTIEIWWGSGRDTIVSLEPYCGSLTHLWGGKARIASFANLKTGMTIDPNERFQLIARQARV